MSLWCRVAHFVCLYFEVMDDFEVMDVAFFDYDLDFGWFIIFAVLEIDLDFVGASP